MSSKKQNIKMYAATALFAVFTFVFYGPYSIYISNAGEFWFSLSDITKVILPVSLITLAFLLTVQLVLPQKAGGFLCRLIFGCGLGLYVQGNFLAISYGNGVMDGTPIQWQYYTKYGLADTAVWVICIALPFILSYVMNKKGKAGLYRKTVIAISCFLTAVQVPAFVVQMITYKPDTHNEFTITSDGEFELAADNNILIFVLDTMDERYYRKYVEMNPDFTDQLEGFTHYDNVLASGARTTIGFPSMFTGVPFIREGTYSEYKEKVWSENSPLKLLSEHGYDVRVFSETNLFSEAAEDYIANFSPDKAIIGSYKRFVFDTYKLTAARFFPHYLKKYVWMDTADFEELRGNKQDYNVKNTVFVQNFRDNGLTINEDYEKGLRLYHLSGAHRPYELDENANYKEEAKVEETTAGCFYIISEYLSALRELGLYDSSTIIITADHGDKNVAEYPVFLLKEANEKQDYHTDHSPLSLFDLPIYLAGFSGDTLSDQKYGEDIHSLREGDSRERHVFVNAANNSRSVIDEYMTTGDADNSDDLVYQKTYEDSLGADTPYTLGETLTFDMDATGNRYAVKGFGKDFGNHTRLLGPVSQLTIPIKDLPEKGDLHASIIIHGVSIKGLEMFILANGEQVFSGKSSQKMIQNGIEFDIPVSVFSENNLLDLELHFPEITDENDRTLDLVKMKINKL